ncbi:MAG: antitoxin Xre/MbcA/ParS toxin-binding domain-containing protein [Steroidobacteraceae bacterium]
MVHQNKARPARVEPAADPGAVLTKAVVRAASLLGLPQAAVAEILGVSRPSVTRMAQGGYRLSPSQPKSWELGTLFVRMFRSLDALLGHEAAARAWLEGPNTDLGARPVELIRSAEGLVRVVHYLDAHRGRV